MTKDKFYFLTDEYRNKFAKLNQNRPDRPGLHI